MQTKCLRLMGKKLLVHYAGGQVRRRGPPRLEEDDDMLAALARELVEKDGIGQSADAIWNELKQIYDQLPTAALPLAPSKMIFRFVIRRTISQRSMTGWRPV